MSTQTPNEQTRSYAHLSDADPEWTRVEAAQRETDKFARELFALPIERLRTLGYRPPPLPADSPIPGKDILVTETKIPTRDGIAVGVRIYRALDVAPGSTLFLNAHGGGMAYSCVQGYSDLTSAYQAGLWARRKPKKRRIVS